MKKLKYIPLALIMSFVIFWVGSIIRCELLTSCYVAEFQIPDEVIGWAEEGGKIKVLDFSKQSARVYYVQNYAGFELDYINRDNIWQLESWRVVWSTSGSADEFVWPYFYHSAEGTGLLLVFGVPFLLIWLLVLRLDD